MILFTNNNSEKLMQTFCKHYICNSPIYLHSPIFTTHYKALNRGNDTNILTA